MYKIGILILADMLFVLNYLTQKCTIPARSIYHVHVLGGSGACMGVDRICVGISFDKYEDVVGAGVRRVLPEVSVVQM